MSYYGKITRLPNLAGLPWAVSFPGYWIAPVVFRDKIYLFYPDIDGDGKNINGAWYTTSDDGDTWKDAWRSCRQLGAATMSIQFNTMPCPVVFQDTLYIFYHGSGQDGTWFTKSVDGNIWTNPVSMNSLLTSNMSFRGDSSPTATVCNGVLFLFWINATRAINWAKFDGGSWGMIYSIYTPGVSVAEYTSVSAAASGERICIIYNGVGNDETYQGNDGMYYFWFNPVQNQWDTKPTSIRNENYPTSSPTTYPSSSPAAWTSTNGLNRVTCAWSGPGDNNIYINWAMVAAGYASVRGGGLLTGKVDRNASSKYTLWSSSCGAVSFRSNSYVFWWGSGKEGIWYAKAEDCMPYWGLA